MAGLGKRFSSVGYKSPKPLIDVMGKPMISRVIENLKFTEAYFIFIIDETQIPKLKFQNLVSEELSSFTIVSIKENTCGPACSALLAEHSINNDDPLLIVNSDQIIHDFSIKSLLSFCDTHQADGVVGCFHSRSEKNSYVKIDDNGLISDIKEKQVISEIATNGLHFWMRGSDFVSSCHEMISMDEMYNGEYYVAPSYNYLIKDGKKILPFFYNLHFPIGTPEDLESYVRMFGDGNSQNR
jgi:NDP-sugar pyrophosphorylase family protein